MKKKVSFKVLLSVVGRSIQQAATWFFGLFGYKREGRYAKWVWRLFATSAAIVMAITAFLFVYRIVDVVVDKWRGPYADCQNVNYDCNEKIANYIFFHNHEDGKGYVYDSRTGKRMIQEVDWIAEPDDEKEPLVCFSNGEKRGYFDKGTGQVVIEPKYDHAWIFSDGLACVDDNGSLKFIDKTGKVVLDPKMAYTPQSEGLFFHHGYCVVESERERLYGLMDKTGKTVMAKEYDSIEPSCGHKLWLIKKDNRMAVLDKNLLPVLPLSEWELEFQSDMIGVTMPDHTMRQYDLQGQLINDFCVSSVDKLLYETDETINDVDRDDDAEITAYTTHHPWDTARLRSYTAGCGYLGLMTADGKIVTMPDFIYIEAIGYDLYLCSLTDSEKIILNGQGDRMRQ